MNNVGAANIRVQHLSRPRTKGHFWPTGTNVAVHSSTGNQLERRFMFTVRLYLFSKKKKKKSLKMNCNSNSVYLAKVMSRIPEFMIINLSAIK